MYSSIILYKLNVRKHFIFPKFYLLLINNLITNISHFFCSSS